MNISIRKALLKDGRESLFLDYYLPGASQKRTKEYLKLYLHSNPKTPKERAYNKKTMLLAESIRSKKLLELQHNTHGFSHLLEGNPQKNFISYFSEQTEKRKIVLVIMEIGIVH